MTPEELRLVRRIAFQVDQNNPQRTLVSFDDLVQVGSLALFRAKERWDAKVGAPFLGYVDQRVRGAMLDEIMRVTWGPKKKIRAGKVQFPLSLERHLEDHPYWELPAPGLELEDSREEVWSQLEPLLVLLTTREWEVVERHFFGGELFKDIADDWGVTGSRVSQIWRKALERMREEANPLGQAA